MNHAEQIPGLSKWINAVGLASTIAPDVEVDADAPVGMMQKVVAYVDSLKAEVERLRERLPKTADGVRFDEMTSLPVPPTYEGERRRHVNMVAWDGSDWGCVALSSDVWELPPVTWFPFEECFAEIDNAVAAEKAHKAAEAAKEAEHDE